MHGYGPGWPWMMLMTLLWVALIAVIVWAVVRLVPRSGGGGYRRQGRKTPQDILDRRFARGEINADEYRQARAHLTDRKPGSS